MKVIDKDLDSCKSEEASELYKRGQGIRFNRIRRITGYLTGSLETWNDSKIQEEKQRIYHSIKGV